jgi:hypothetical protein
LPTQRDNLYIDTDDREKEKLVKLDMETFFKTNGTNSKVVFTDFETAVLQRYGDAAQEMEACLCLPVCYDEALLDVIAEKIIIQATRSCNYHQLSG